MPKELAKKIEQDKKDKSFKVANKKVDSLKSETENKVNALEYYNSLSDADKVEFQKQIKIKKIRNNYLSYLKYVYGDNYIITKFHKFLATLCQNVIERVEKGEKVRLAISCPPQHGKGYETDFPILTTNGWKKHGDLRYGDYVYNDMGEPVMVLGHQTPYMHECLKITFQNGESHIVTREHLWKVYIEKENRENGKHKNIRVAQVLETQELMNNLNKYRRNPYVLINEPLHNEEKELPIDPYVLGLWLGDGCSASNEIVVSDNDLTEELCGIGNKENYYVTKKQNNPNVSYIRLGNYTPFGKKGLRKNDFTKRLRELNLLNNKHIPIDYLLSSEKQRWELLRGLMDTDGCCNFRDATCEFCNTSKELAYNVYTLLHSLGIKARIGEYDAKLYGRFISKKYRVSFNPNKTDVIFKIKRKQERIENKTKKDREDKYKYFIKSIEPVGKRLVSCISVDGGMYLAGKELIPTHNSITLTESLPSWFIGRNPDLRCIVTAYNADIAEKFGDKNRQLVKNYGKEIFGIEISDSQDNKTLWDIKKHLGGLYATGLGGSLTSNNGALIIVDDPFKNEVEANTQGIRDTVWSNFTSSVMTRQRGNGNAIIVIHTRWNDDDLIGRLKKIDSEEWIIVNIPCIWESGYDTLLHRKIGETLCPELGFDGKWAESMKKTIGLRQWNALYQGKPYVEGGNIVKRSDIKFYDHTTIPTIFDEITLSCDLSFGGTKTSNDPNCLSVWGRLGANHYLLKVINKKCGFSETIDLIKHLCSDFPQMRRKIIEKKANGNATIEMLNQQIGGFVPYDPKGDSKETRFKAVAPYFESGNVYFPSEKLEPTIEELIEQVIRFPNVGHDDFVDTISQYLLNYTYKVSGSRIGTDSTYKLFSQAIRGFKI